MRTTARFATTLLSASLSLAASACKKPAAHLTTAKPSSTPTTEVLRLSTTQDNRTPCDSTQRMAARLAKLSAEIDVSDLPWVVNHRRVAIFAAQLARAHDWKSQAAAEFTLAGELLNDAQNADCLAHLDAFQRLVAAHRTSLDADERKLVRLLRILANMRSGEIDNCCAHHNPDSCLLPLSGGAIYKRKDGPRRAIPLLLEQLAEDPTDLSARWLLNIAYMAIGEYPAHVPSWWLIDPKSFASEYDIKRFPDVAAFAGLDTFGHSGGCIVDDFDDDGLLDVVRSDIGLDSQLRFFHNNGDGTFTDRTAQSGLAGEVGGLSILSADYNNDGHLDILVLRGGWFGAAGRFPMSLLRNNGDGTFTDVTEEAGLLSGHPTQAAVWFDYDGDGRLDLFVGNESKPGGPANLCQLFHNNPDGTFTECAIASGINVTKFVKAVASADFLNTSRPGLYISQMGGESNVLFRNDGPRDPANPGAGWKFTDITQSAGLSRPMRSFPCFFFDYDNDGWLDLFVCGFGGGAQAVAAEFLGQPSSGEHPRLYRNNRDGTFSDIAPSLGLDMTIIGMAGNFGDLDNDGFLDFYIGTGDPTWPTLVPNRMFRNDRGKRFQDVTTSGGFGNIQKGHGIAFADINNDGQQDIYEVLGGAYSGDQFYSALYANPGHDNHWITLKLEGAQSNRSAVGARIKITIADPTAGAANGGERAIYRTVCTGGSFGCSALRQEIGLGKADSIKSIEITWPATGQTQRLPGLPMQRFYKIIEGNPTAIPLNIPTFPLITAAPAAAAHAPPINP